jgi:hypothetical protein
MFCAFEFRSMDVRRQPGESPPPSNRRRRDVSEISVDELAVAGGAEAREMAAMDD